MNEYKILHLFSGIGGAALGFQEARQEYRGLVGMFRTLAGIDCDPEACQDFESLTGAPAVQSLDPYMPDGSPLRLAGNSDARWRERIGNMVPKHAAQAIGEEILLSFLASEVGDEFRLTVSGIWVVYDIENRLPHPLCH